MTEYVSPYRFIKIKKGYTRSHDRRTVSRGHTPLLGAVRRPLIDRGMVTKALATIRAPTGLTFEVYKTTGT